jgi:hypothetical protein
MKIEAPRRSFVIGYYGHPRYSRYDGGWGYGYGYWRR